MGRNALATGIIATAAAAVLALSSAPAAAAAAPPSDGVHQTISFVGSDTIEDFTNAYVNGLTKNDNTSVYGGWNNDGVANPGHEDTAVNVVARLDAGQSISVPVDGSCTTPITYDSTNPPPDGSGAGRDALFLRPTTAMRAPPAASTWPAPPAARGWVRTRPVMRFTTSSRWTR
ncbi:hypothetical protein [Fodinicola feengrottensis]|uniref:hypothetical protein n=1 Tax=Fodinicola feengrottensis TaxID=435914 RepID=UPI0013D35946|nr:hypothetical protein [Fodinicola feengrottensis]